MTSPRSWVPDVPMLADCDKCELLIRHHATSWLCDHLVHDHDLSEGEASATADWVAKQVHKFILELPVDTFVNRSVNIRCG
jgi:hypothetical protein